MKEQSFNLSIVRTPHQYNNANSIYCAAPLQAAIVFNPNITTTTSQWLRKPRAIFYQFRIDRTEFKLNFNANLPWDDVAQRGYY